MMIVSVVDGRAPEKVSFAIADETGRLRNRCGSEPIREYRTGMRAGYWRC
jgi:hypothetical protein